MANIIDAIIRLRDQFTPTLSRVRTQLSETERVAQRAARDVTRLGNSISGIGEAMLPMAGAITGGLGYAVNSFSDFEYNVVKAAAKCNASSEVMEKMSNRILEVGAAYPISASEAAQMADKMAMLGFTGEQVIGSLEGVVQASVASGTGLEEMGQTVAGLMNILNP